MILCLYCQKTIEKPRMFKGRVVQKFCNDNCRNSYHKKRRKDNEHILQEISAIIERVRTCPRD